MLNIDESMKKEYWDDERREAYVRPHDEICISCGKKFSSHIPKRRRQFCNECLKQHIDEHCKIVSAYAELKVKIMHEAAIRKLEKSKDIIIISDYTEAIKAVKEMEEINPSCFMSAEEILTAIILFKENYYFKVNHQVGKYKIDFFLPEDFICLEIDGNLHDLGQRRAKDGKRDIEVREILGYEWETVRIPTNYVEKYPTRLTNAMEELAFKQQELRRKHHGMLPENYSKSTKAYYKKLNPEIETTIYLR